MARARDKLDITPDVLLRAYSIGLFPMAESAHDPNLFWVDPRGARHISARRPARHPLARQDGALGPLRGAGRLGFRCGDRGLRAGGPGREGTWINTRIRALYRDLFDMGRVHTIETWADGELVGGLYGVALGAAFFGESMFHRRTDASKVALVHLVARLRVGGFRLLDTQFVTDHLASLGAIAVPKHAYHLLLADAVERKADFRGLARESVRCGTKRDGGARPLSRVRRKKR